MKKQILIDLIFGVSLFSSMSFASSLNYEGRDAIVTCIVLDGFTAKSYFRVDDTNITIHADQSMTVPVKQIRVYRDNQGQGKECGAEVVGNEQLLDCLPGSKVELLKQNFPKPSEGCHNNPL